MELMARGGVRGCATEVVDGSETIEETSQAESGRSTESHDSAAAYEEFLRKAEARVKRLSAKQPDEGVPATLHGKREATVIYNNLSRLLAAGRARAAGVAESPTPNTRMSATDPRSN